MISKYDTREFVSRLQLVIAVSLAVCLASCTPAGTSGTVDTDPGSDGNDSNETGCGECEDNEICLDGRCVCKPHCDGTRCDDGCGGLCDCFDGDVCDADGACVPAGECKETCASEGWKCGSVCGEVCGTCPADESCLDHRCSHAESCADCPLNLVLLESAADGQKLTSITLGLDYQPREGDPRPRLADIRIVAGSGAELTGVEAGPALKEADKELFLDPKTNRNFRQRDDGAYQMVVQSSASVKELGPGRLLTLTFQADGAKEVDFHLEKRSQVFAPLGADAPLQGTDYENPVVVSK